MNAMQQFEELKRLVADAEEDVFKGDGGNRAATTRARKKMQEVKNAAQEVRKALLEGRADGDDSTPADQAPAARI